MSGEVESGAPTRPGFTYAGRIKVRYAEIDGQKIVFNSRYLEYADVAVTEFWQAARMEAAVGAWESHVRRAEVDFLKPFVLGDSIDLWCKMEAVGRTSYTQRVELTHPATGDLHAAITLVGVGVDLTTGQPLPHSDAVRGFLERLASP